MRRVGDSDPLSEFSVSASGSPFVTVMCSYRELAKFLQTHKQDYQESWTSVRCFEQAK